MKKFALRTVFAVAVKAAFDYLKSPEARRWEIALAAGVGAAVEQAIHQAF